MSAIQIKQLETTWETEIKKGNCFFQSFAFTEASTHYMEAMIIAELLVENIATASDHALRIPGMYFTACINIAHNYWGIQEVNNAADYFLYCTFKMKQLSDKPGIDPSVKQASLIYWIKSVQFFTTFSQKTGMHMPANLDKEETYLQLQKLKDLFVMNKENMN